MLHQVSGSKEDVLTALHNAINAFSQNNAAVQAQMTAKFPDEKERNQARQRILADLTTAYQQASKEDADPKWFMSRDPMAAMAQAAMNTRAQRATTGEPNELAILPALQSFGALDPGWIECIVDGFATLLKGKAQFIQHQALNDFLHDIPDQVTIALVSDWGATNDAARSVARQIRAANPDMVIHLGDIYYAGQTNEALAMLKLWPLADSTGAIAAGTSFALNGNHEMYSGGHAYFETVLKTFGQQASYFGLRNSNWQILAFDSAYIEHRLLPPTEAAKIDSRLQSQWNWLVDKVKNSTLATIFLSHHQPVSAFENENNDGAKLRGDFQQFSSAAGRPVFGWFFGHEHRSTVYDDERTPYFARLIGNGCIPHTAPPSGQKPEPGCFSFSNMNTRANADGDAVSGFALLRFDGADVNIRYIDEEGVLFFEEDWEAPLPG